MEDEPNQEVTTMKQLRLRAILILLACTLAVALVARPAEAVQITSSSSTKDSGVLISFRTAFPISDLRIGFELLGSPNLTALLGRADYIPGAPREESWLLGGGLNFGWHLPLQQGEGLIGIGVTPFLGYYHLATFTDNFQTAGPPFNIAGVTSLGGVHYGARLDIDLPVGAYVYAGLAGWTLTNGGWNQRIDSTQVAAQGSYNTSAMTLPRFWVGLGWSPIFFFNAYVGYSWMQLPTGLRGQSNNALTGGGRTSISSIEAGIQVLWFSL